MTYTEVSKAENKKYVDLYASRIGLPTTQTVMDLAKFIANTASKGEKLLELGCGRGQVVQYLREQGYDCKGIDITSVPILEKYSEVPEWFTETAVWELPFADNQFDFTFSTDIMEHVPPELVERSVQEIYRVTRTETFHAISGLPNTPYHMTVQPIHW